MKTSTLILIGVGGLVVVGGGFLLLRHKGAPAGNTAPQAVVVPQANVNVQTPVAQVQALGQTAANLIDSGANLANTLGSFFS